MRSRSHTRSLALALLLVATIAQAGVPAGAADLNERIDAARTMRQEALDHLRRLDGQLSILEDRYARLAPVVGRTALRVVTALRTRDAAEETLADVNERFRERVRAIYEEGPAGGLRAFLQADDFAEIADIHAFQQGALEADVALLHEAERAELRLSARAERAEQARRALVRQRAKLVTVLEQMRSLQFEAETAAREAGVEIRSLERRQQRLAEAGGYTSGLEDLVNGSAGVDQSALLSLLGPSGGRSCDIPPGLKEAGEGFDGYASWYGWDFAGRSTASGAIFDPRLFTAANRWLPFGVFLRVRYGNRCAIVLVNDRGPYGNYERVIDLSYASAHYLGVGVSWVHADILVPRNG